MNDILSVNNQTMRHCSRCDIAQSPRWHLYWTKTKMIVFFKIQTLNCL